MNERLQRAKRMVSLCEQFYNLTRWKLLDCTQQQLVLDQNQRDLLNFLEEDAVFTARFAVTAMQRLHDIAEKIALIEEYKEIQKGKVLQTGRLRNLSEKLLKNLECENRSETERKVLNELIEGSLISRE